MNKYKSAKEFLNYLNLTLVKIHKKYVDYFWLSYMGDHSVDKKMAIAHEEIDNFRSNKSHIELVKKFIAISNKKDKTRLQIWLHYFSLFQVPIEAVPIRRKVEELESKIARIRTKRKEGYIEPYSKKFIKASYNKMRSIISTTPDENIRKACFIATQKLPFDTLDDYIKLIGLRNHYAKILGYNDFYEYKARLDENMSKRELFSIFEKLYYKTKFAFKNIRKIERKIPGMRKPWNYSYMLSGNFTKEEDPYFQFENVLSYWGRSFAALGVGLSGGSIRLDLLDRNGKYNNGFCHYPDLVYFKDAKRISGSANFTSNAIPGQLGSGVQGINTVFHEAGHAVDGLNSMQKETCVNTEYPPSSISWAETHSMFMDSISDSIEWRTRYAKKSNGEAYPFELFERKMKTLFPLRPLSLMSICFVVEFERRIYECKKLTRKFVLQTAILMHKKYFDQTEDSISALNIPHIYSWGSSGYYHGYGLAELTVYQWREYFTKKYGYIVDNPKVGKEMTKIWSYASVFPAKKLVKMATGKKLSPDTFIKDVNQSFNDFIKSSKDRINRLKTVPLYQKPINLNGRIEMVHGKMIIANNTKSFEDMDKTFRTWLGKMSKN